MPPAGIDTTICTGLVGNDCAAAASAQPASIAARPRVKRIIERRLAGLSNPLSGISLGNMDRDATLQRIEHATHESEILEALRDFVMDPANGHDERLAEQLAGPTEVAAVAYELTRLRLRHETQSMVPEDLESLFARASMRIAQILDRTGGWEAYRVRAMRTTTSSDR
jgi:hypothetical protein